MDRRRGDEHLVADLGVADPRGGGAGDLVGDHVDVDLVHVVPHSSGRIGAERVPFIRMLLAPLRVPVVAGGHRVERNPGAGEDDLDALVVSGIAVLVEIRAGEGEPAQARRQLGDARDLRAEQPHRSGDSTQSWSRGCSCRAVDAFGMVGAGRRLRRVGCVLCVMAPARYDQRGSGDGVGDDLGGETEHLIDQPGRDDLARGARLRPACRRTLRTDGRRSGRPG